MTHRSIQYLVIILVGICGLVQPIKAQIYDENGQYVDTLFHDHINRQADDFVEVSLIVSEPGGALYSIFGHACLHMVCKSFNVDYIFSYESENAESKIFTFLAGNLRMGMDAIPFNEYLSTYAAEGREVKEYPLNLPPDAKQRLWKNLDKQYAQGMYLPYDYETRGCAYACSQFVKEALYPTQIQYAPWTKKQMRTRREMCNDYAKDDYPWNMWFIMSIVGTDKELDPTEKLIIPTELVEAWQHATINGEPMLGEERIISASTKVTQKTYFTPVMAACLVLLLVILGWIFHKPYADWLLLAVITLFGALLTYLVPISNLPCSNWNWLLIPFNLLIPIAWHWRRYWALPYAIVLCIWWICMVAWPHTLIATANLILVVAEIVMLLKQWWLTNKRFL